MRGKSILIIGNYPPPFGGVPRHIEYLVPALVTDGFNVHVLSGGSTGVEYYEHISIYKYRRWDRRKAFFLKPWYNIALWRRHLSSFDVRSLKEIYGFLSLVSLGRRIIEKYDISIIKAYNLTTYAPVGAMLSEEFQLPLVISNFGEYYSRSTFFDRHMPLVKFTACQATQRLSMTRHCAAIYQKCGISLPYEVIYYGIEIDKFHPTNDGQNVRTKLGIQPTDYVILYLARMTEEMGLRVFIQAVERILAQNINIKVIIGGKPQELFEDALEAQREHPHAIIVCPDIPLIDLPHYYGAADLVVVPTLGDRACGSLSAAEASATAKPVVASRVGGIPEFVADNVTGLLVPPGNPEALSDAILRIYEDKQLAKEFGQNGRRFVEKYFNKDETNRKIVEILNKALETKL